MEALRRQKFIERIKDATLKKAKNSQILSQEKYGSIIQSLQRIETNGAKEPKDFRLKSRYQVLEIGDVHQLVKKGTDLKFVIMEDLFDVINSAHIATGHGGKNVLRIELSKKYANISQEQLLAFLKLCEECQLKKSKVKKSLVVKPILSNAMNSRCQVSCIKKFLFLDCKRLQQK